MQRPAPLALGLTLFFGALAASALTGCGTGAAQTDAPEVRRAKPQAATAAADAAEGTSRGMEAIRQASAAGKYLFLFFSKASDEQTRALREVFDKAMQQVADRAQGVAIDVADPAEKAVVAKFDLSRAPMPLVLAMAPNGAITGGFPGKFTERELLDAFASPCTEKVMKSLQDGKLVFVCVQNGKTKSNDAAMQGVREFQSDARYAAATEIVTLDPTDEREAAFLTDLKVSPDVAEATTVFVVPPGQAIGKLEGATSKDALVELLGKANTGCGPGGCGPGGCGPR